MGVKLVANLVMLFISASTVASQGNWKTFAGLEYDVVLKPVNNYKQASSNCQAIGGILVVIKTYSVQQFLGKTIRKMSKISPPLYIGLTRSSYGGSWRWSNGRPHTARGFSFWKVGEPNNWRRNENCVTLGESGRPRWTDTSCNLKAGYICQRKPGARNASSSDILPTTVETATYAKAKVKVSTLKATRTPKAAKTATQRQSITLSSTVPPADDDYPWLGRVFPNFYDLPSSEEETTITATKDDSTVRHTTNGFTSHFYIGIIAGLSVLLVLSICANAALCLKAKSSSKKKEILMSTPTPPNTANKEQTYQLELVNSLKSSVQEDGDGYLVPNRTPMQLPGQVKFPDGAYIELG